jgi:ADP-heptose:LPS heptosyltransferase
MPDYKKPSGGERGNASLRLLDFWAGVPLVFAAGGMRRLGGLSRRQRSDHPRTIGVICLGAIGDLLLVTGLLGQLREAFPDARIEVVATRSNAAVFPLLKPDYAACAFEVTDVRGMLGHLRRSRYDILIDTSQWARLGALLAALSRAGTTVGFSTAGQYRHYGYECVVPHSALKHEADNFLALGSALVPGLRRAPEIVIPEHPSAACPPLPEGPVVFFHMWPAGVHAHLKEWPGECWAELARTVHASGYAIALTGGKEDRERTEAFLAQCLPGELADSGRVVSVAGRMSLPDLAFCFSRAAAAVSVNTGVMHLAALCGVPLVGLHGPTNPRRWGPLGGQARALLPDEGDSAYLDLGFEYPPNAENVMRFLRVNRVLEALREMGVRV